MRSQLVLFFFLAGSVCSSETHPRADRPPQTPVASKDQCEVWHRTNPNDVVSIPIGDDEPEELVPSADDKVAASIRRRSRNTVSSHIMDLIKRAGSLRNFDICANTTDEFTYNSPSYPEGDNSQCYDSADWSDNRNFNLKKGARPPPPPAPPKGKKKPKVREYKDEHILELQTLKWFFQTHLMSPLPDNKWKHKNFDKDPITNKTRTACAYFKKFWDDDTHSRIGPIPKSKQIKEPNKAIDFVGRAHPNKDENGGELVVLEGELNNVKQMMFSKRIYNMVAKNNEKKWKKAVQELKKMEGVLKRFKEVILVVKYMDNPAVNEIYKKQAIRIGNQLEEAEILLEANWKNQPEKYKKQGLKSAWMSFIKEDTDLMNEKIQRFYRTWKPYLDKAISDYPNFVASPAYRKHSPKEQKEMEEFLKDMKAIVAEVNKGQKFRNPF